MKKKKKFSWKMSEVERERERGNPRTHLRSKAVQTVCAKRTRASI